MPAVFVHGVPDTSEMWAPVIDHLSRTDVVTLRLPGFGEPVPAGFSCTKEAYAAWIVDQLRAIGEPVDLVGHDWGGLLTQYVGSTEPELVRTWVAADASADRDYVWHDLAQLWQTPEVGEQVMAAMVGDALVDGLRDAGHPDPTGCAARIDDRMKDSILKLYRSAITVGAEWQPAVERNERPALALWGANDQYGSSAGAERLARRAHGTAVVIDGGHWAVIEHPDEAARAIDAFWASHP
jgi:pimeloyl-ACP methyl ester carboxylesterase